MDGRRYWWCSMVEGIGGVSWKKVLVVYHGRRYWWCIMEEGIGGVAQREAGG